MMAITKEQWQQIENKISHPYGTVKLMCDGYVINARVEKYKELKYCVVVYVDGFFELKLTDGEDERALKFHRKIRRHFLSGSQRADALKQIKRRNASKELKSIYQGWLDKYTDLWMPYWPNSKAFCRHIRKTCTEIELLE